MLHICTEFEGHAYIYCACGGKSLSMRLSFFILRNHMCTKQTTGVVISRFGIHTILYYSAVNLQRSQVYLIRQVLYEYLPIGVVRV